MSKCEFNKLHFGMGVLLYIKFAACIFSEHIFLRTPLDGCFWHRLLSTLSSCIWNRVNLHVVETEWEAKNFHKNFYDILEKGVEIKRHITYFCNKSNYEWPLKSKWKNHEKALIETFFRFGDCFWAQGNRHPKNWKNIFFQYMLLFKGSCTLRQSFYILEEVLNLVFLLVLPSQTYLDAVKVWTHW